MNFAHIHLMLNHIPVIGAPLCLLLLLYGLAVRQAAVQRAALLMCVLITLLTIPVYLTGEPAEGFVEGVQGVTGGAIHAHEDRAEVAFVAMDITGALALMVLVLGQRRDVGSDRATPHRAAVILVGAALIVTSTLMASTANLGGRIHHPEIGITTPPDSTPARSPSGNEQDEQGDATPE